MNSDRNGISNTSRRFAVGISHRLTLSSSGSSFSGTTVSGRPFPQAVNRAMLNSTSGAAHVRTLSRSMSRSTPDDSSTFLMLRCDACAQQNYMLCR